MNISKYAETITAAGEAIDAEIMWLIISCIFLGALFVISWLCSKKADSCRRRALATTTNEKDAKNSPYGRHASKWDGISSIVAITAASLPAIIIVMLLLIPGTFLNEKSTFAASHERICTECGSGNTGDSDYCVCCGDEINSEDILTVVAWWKMKRAATVKDDEIACSYCMEITTKGNSHCPNCGNVLQGSK